MSITITRQPSTFQPAENPNIWEFQSDNANLVYIRLELTLPSTDLFMVVDLYPTPANPTKVFVNVSSILKNYVKHQFKGYASNLIDTFTSPVFAYRISAVERINDSGTIIDGDGYSTLANKYIFNAKLDLITAKSYNENNYVVNNSNQIKFLTNKPSKISENDFSNEGLSFIQNSFSNQLTARYEFYSSSGALLYTHNVNLTDQSTIKYYRLNTSLKKLKEVVTGVNFNNVSYYTVKLVDSTSTVKSETKTYIIQELACHLQPINIVWVNKFGALETVQLYQPESTFSSSKTTIKHDQYKFDSTGFFSSFENNVFNVVDEVINSTTEQTIKLNTLALSDIEQSWLSGIINSKQIYLQVDNELFVPVTLADSTYNMKSSDTITEPNVKQFSFKLADGFSADVPLG